MEDTLSARVRLRAFEFDLRTGELLADGQTIRLSDKPRRLLNILIEHGNELVTRAEIQRELWPNDTIVDFEQGINTAIKTVRQALGDAAEEPRYIETIPRRGYRLLAPVEAIESTPPDVVAKPAPRDTSGQEAASLVGRRISHYRVLEVIGGGGMGMVYRAEDLKLGRRVALKFLPQELANDPAALPRFEREARTASALNHPNICTIYGIEEYQEQPVLAMELLEGETLRDRLAALAGEQKKLATNELLNIGIQICNGLQAAHEKGILHRDVKPANIYLTNSGQVKILDFGLAKLLFPGGKEPDSEPPPLTSSDGRSEASRESCAGEASLTRTGLTMGTAGYMSPEQVRGEKLDARSDLFSFGLVLYEMAAGQRTFSGETAALVQEAILHDSPVSLRELNSALPAKLVSIVDKALEKNRERRYQSAADIRIDLQALQHRQYRKGRRRLWIAAGAAVVLVLAITAGWVLRSRSWNQPPPSAAMQNKSIAVLSFHNMSGDVSLNWLDGGLAELLTTNLSQVKGMDVLSREQVSSAIKRKGQQDAPELPADVALDVARDAGADTLVTGSLMKLGASKLRVDLHVQDARTGKILFSDKVESEDINGIFTMVDAMTARLAERTLPASQIPATMPGIADVTTSSVEALRHYQAGEDYWQKFQLEKAIREFEEAVRLDPQFAMAYYWMGLCYGHLGNGTKGTEAERAAERLASRMPRVQQLQILYQKALRLRDAGGMIQATEELAKEEPRVGLRYLALALTLEDPARAGAVYPQAIALDPNNPDLYNERAYYEAFAGHEAAALEACDQLRGRIGANEPHAWDTRGDVLFMFGHDEEAAAAYRRSLELDPDRNGARVVLTWAYADQGNYELATAELNRYKQRVTGVSLLKAPGLEADLLQMEGMPERALPLYANMVPELLKAGQASDAVGALYNYASLAFLLGQEQAALSFARRQKLPDKKEQFAVSFLEAASGNEAGAEAALQQFAAANPDVPARAIQAMRDWNTGLSALRNSNPYAVLPVLPKLRFGTWNLPWPAFLVRGRIRLLANDDAGAERDFKSSIALNRGAHAIPLAEQLSHFYLGQVYEQMGKRNDAIREYQKFLTPYAKSDSRLPQLTQAKAALKRLQG